MPKLTARELAQRLGLPFRGNGGQALTGAAPLEDAGPESLSFIGSAKFFEAGLKSHAGCIVAPGDYPAATGQTIIESPQPRSHFAQALTILFPESAIRAGVHASAVIAEDAAIDPSAGIGACVVVGAGARIGARTRIGAGSSVGACTTIGDDCTVHSRVSIYHRVTIGDRAIIHSGAVIGADGFGFELASGRYRKVPQVGSVQIGSDTEIGANACIDRATLGVTVIGEGTKLDNMVHIAHNCRIGKHVVIAAQTGLAGGVTIGDHAVVGGQVGVGDKARIEAGAVIGSGAGILTAKIVRAGEPVWGTPARPLRQYLSQLATLARLAKRRGGQ